MSALNMNIQMPCLFHTYQATKYTAPNCTIWKALHCAPPFHKPPQCMSLLPHCLLALSHFQYIFKYIFKSNPNCIMVRLRHSRYTTPHTLETNIMLNFKQSPPLPCLCHPAHSASAAAIYMLAPSHHMYNHCCYCHHHICVTTATIEQCACKLLHFESRC